MNDHGKQRVHDTDRPDDVREPAERDLDRILYSSAFRRLSGVTQVVSADETLLFHNRLTHTLKVAQIAKRLAERLERREGGNQVDLSPGAAEAAALAHDLGHPPFGHIAEAVLQGRADSAEVGINGYEGNAQTFRIVCRLSQRADSPGLNLTHRTLRAILKYPWLRQGSHERDKKWGAYDSEASDFHAAIGTEAQEAPTSLEAEIMDWADDITYAVHDLEDFYRAGLTPFPRLHGDELERSRFVAKATKSLNKYSEFDSELAARAFHDVLQLVPLSREYEGTNDDRRRLHVTGSNLITRYLTSTHLNHDKTGLSISPDIWHEVNLLKQLTWHYVINSPDLAAVQEGQKRIVEQLFDSLWKWCQEDGSSDRLPTRLREIIRAIGRDEEASASLDRDQRKMSARAVCDYITTLTEAQAIELHGRLLGLTRSSMLQGWIGT